MHLIEAQKIITSDPKHARAPHAAEYSHGSAFTQGAYKPIEQGVVPITDSGFIHADAAYDVVSASAGYIFRMEDHIKRFTASCEKFALVNPYTEEQTVEILNNLVKLTGLKDAYIWWAVTRGELSDSDRVKLEYVNKFYAFVTPYMFIHGDEMRTRGAKVKISTDYLRIPETSVDPTAKNFHWMDMKLSILEARTAGAEWSVLLDAKGNLTEAPGCNIFIIKDDTLKTPNSGCLEGITRQTVFELAEELGLRLEVTKVPSEELLEADEAFLTSTAGGVMPVSFVDGRSLGGQNGPGELTTQLHNLYWEKRWNGWLGEAIDYETPFSVSAG
ncbi:MAG: branched-chain amino acid--2-keto-4-methylthiobutyrate aminotransferase [Pseudomonadales bacterium]|nr:branched-chain amino acid--2-keto-4-methylthiobutyrate aminotransferase [Pseudomonadales bacterium]